MVVALSFAGVAAASSFAGVAAASSTTVVPNIAEEDSTSSLQVLIDDGSMIGGDTDGELDMFPSAAGDNDNMLDAVASCCTLDHS